jgi:hypothetical protein
VIADRIKAPVAEAAATALLYYEPFSDKLVSSKMFLILSAIACVMWASVYLYIGPTPPPPPNIGWLQPANEPVPHNGCDRLFANPPSNLTLKDAVLIVIGDNGAFRTRNPAVGSLKNIAIQLEECPLVSLESGPNGALIDANIYDRVGHIIGHVRDNQFIIPNENNLTIEKTGDLSTLIVHNADGDELLYIRYLNRSTFRIRGVFSCPYPTLRTIFVTDEEIAGFGMHANCSGNNGGPDYRLE